MTSFRIQIDPSLCSGFGTCVDAHPAALQLEGGVARVLVGVSDDPAALTAAAACPMGAVAVFDAATDEQVA
jgi:ferredoxin